jgi:pyrroloquinoline quinone (PQQ) biosynthesis protein C
MTQTPRDFLDALRGDIERHPAVNHLFLNRLATSPMSREDYRVFAEQHYPLVCAFTSYLEVLLLGAPDGDARLWLARVLVDEYGEGSDGKDHATLYVRFLEAAGGDAARATLASVPAAAARFIATHQRLVRQSPFLVGLGAIGPGHEWAIPKMFHAIIPGLRRAGFAEEAIGYFTLHVEQDDDHGRWLEQALLRYTHSSAAQEQVRKGALASLDARLRFWSDVQRAVVRYRQPHVSRQDGPVPRALAHELALTAWDGSRIGRLWARATATRAERQRPDLAALVARGRRLG